MKTLFGAVAGALTLGAILVSYNLGDSHAFSRDAAMMGGYQPMANPYLVQASQTGYVSPYAAYPATQFAGQSPYGVKTPVTYAARPSGSQRSYASEPAAKPARTWQKSAMLIGGSAAGGAGVGALIGGKKGAGIGALLGGGTAAIYDQIKRR